MNVPALVNLSLVAIGAVAGVVGAFASKRFRTIVRDTYLPSLHEDHDGDKKKDHGALVSSR